jgi:hypothetical protein
MVAVPLASSPRDLSSHRGASWTADLRLAGAAVTRVVRVPPGGRDLVVNDIVSPVEPGVDSSSASVVMVWNLGKDVVRVEPIPPAGDGRQRWTLVTRRGQRARLEIALRDGATASRVDVVRGREAPARGWYSPRQNERRAVTTIAVTVDGSRTGFVETRVRLLRR